MNLKLNWQMIPTRKAARLIVETLMEDNQPNDVVAIIEAYSNGLCFVEEKMEQAIELNNYTLTKYWNRVHNLLEVNFHDYLGN